MDKRRVSLCSDGRFCTRAEDGELYIEGYFVTFSGEYPLWDGAVERVDPHALDGQLEGDIRALVNHDTTLVLGRTTAGTLSLRLDEQGLWGRIRINQNDQDALNLYSRVARGDVSQCSFGFEILDERVDDLPDGRTVFTILRVRLYEVSVVTFPAYADTIVSARKRDVETINQRKISAWRDAMRKKMKGE